MSFKAVDVAINTPCPSNCAKLVLICLAHHYNHADGRCFPSYERMAAMMGVAKSSITRAIKELVDAKLIGKRKGQRSGSYEGPNHYRLLFYIQARIAEQNGKRLYYGDDHALTTRLQNGTPSSSQEGSEEGRPKRKRPQRNAPRRRMTATWHPTATAKAYALEKGFPEDEYPDLVIDFRRYWLSVGIARADFQQTFLRWVDKELKIRSQHHGNPGTRPVQWREERAGALRDFYDASVAAADRRRRDRSEGTGEGG